MPYPTNKLLTIEAIANFEKKNLEPKIEELKTTFNSQIQELKSKFDQKLIRLSNTLISTIANVENTNDTHIVTSNSA